MLPPPLYNRIDPQKFYGCYISLEKRYGKYFFLVFDKRYKPEGVALFVAVLDQNGAEHLADFLRSAQEGAGIFYGGQTEEDAEHFKETGEKPLGTELPPLEHGATNDA